MGGITRAGTPAHSRRRGDAASGQGATELLCHDPSGEYRWPAQRAAGQRGCGNGSLSAQHASPLRLLGDQPRPETEKGTIQGFGPIGVVATPSPFGGYPPTYDIVVVFSDSCFPIRVPLFAFSDSRFPTHVFRFTFSISCLPIHVFRFVFSDSRFPIRVFCCSPHGALFRPPSPLGYRHISAPLFRYTVISFHYRNLL